MIRYMDFADFKPIDMLTLDKRALDPLNAELDQSTTGSMRDLAEMIYITLRSAEPLRDVSDEDIARQSVASLYQIASTLGGQAVYISAGAKSILADKYRSIVAAFTGNNHRELSRKFGVSEMRIRQILYAAHQSRKAKQA